MPFVSTSDRARVRPGIPPRREDLLGHEPYGAPQVDAAHLLNVNENPHGPSPALTEDLARAVAEAATALNRYPDREFTALRADLAAYVAAEASVPEPPVESVWAANGSNEIMHQVMLAFGGPGRTALGFTPHYSMYPEYARDTFTTWVTEPRGPAPEFSLTAEAVTSAIVEHSPDIVVLTSPNNPTGTALDPAVVTAAAQALAAGPERAEPGLLVIDEAYGEFRRDGVPSALELLQEHPHLVVARTMSKAFALAGARIGYLVGAPEIVDALRIVRLPYHLSGVTQAVARTALAHRGELLARVDELRTRRDELAEHLRERGHVVAPSDANFLFFQPLLRGAQDRHQVWQSLLDAGVLIREVGPQPWLRVSIGTAEDDAAFRTALEEADPR